MSSQQVGMNSFAQIVDEDDGEDSIPEHFKPKRGESIELRQCKRDVHYFLRLAADPHCWNHRMEPLRVVDWHEENPGKCWHMEYQKWHDQRRRDEEEGEWRLWNASNMTAKIKSLPRVSAENQDGRPNKRAKPSDDDEVVIMIPDPQQLGIAGDNQEGKASVVEFEPDQPKPLPVLPGFHRSLRETQLIEAKDAAKKSIMELCRSEGISEAESSRRRKALWRVFWNAYTEILGQIHEQTLTSEERKIYDGRF